MHETHHNFLYNLLEGGFNGLLNLYEWTLRAALRLRPVIMLLIIALVIGTGYLFKSIPKGFLPSEDTSQVMASTEAAEGISFEDMVRHQGEVMKVMAEEPAVEAFMSSVGSGGPNVSGNTGRLFIRLRPREERPGIEAFIQQLRPKVSHIPGIRVFLQNRPAISMGGQMTKSLYQFTLYGTNLDSLYEYAPRLEERMRELPGFQDVTSDLLLKNPEIEVEIDRDKASALGVTARLIEETLYNAYGSRQISTIYAPNNQYRVIVEVKREFQLDPSALAMLYVRTASGQLVPLHTVATLRRSVGPMTITHLGQLPSVTLSFNLAPGYALGEAVSQVQALAAEILPESVSTSFMGTAQAFQKSMGGVWILLLAAVIVIYIVLGILYESFIHPLTILSGLPAASVGALLTLQMFKMELNIYSLVGIIMLIGIVKKNAIMMVDFAIHAQHSEGLPPAEAIKQACLTRFRPILMTTMAAIMGTLPIAIGLGAGAETRRPLGMAVVGGLIVSQLLTLYVTPVFYIYMEKFQTLLRGARPGA